MQLFSIVFVDSVFPKWLEWLFSGAGWTCQGDVNDIKKTIIEILAHKDLLVQKGMNARKLSFKFDWDKLAEKFHDEVSKNIGIIL